LQLMVEEAITESGAKGMSEMGQVMKIVLSKAAGQADNKQVSELVKNALSQL